MKRVLLLLILCVITTTGILSQKDISNTFHALYSEIQNDVEGYHYAIAEEKLWKLLAKPTITEKERGQCYLLLGKVNRHEKKWKVATPYYNIAKSIFEASNLSVNLGSVYREIATLSEEKSEYDTAFIFARKALEIFEEANETVEIGRTYVVLANIGKQLKENDFSQECFQKAISIFEEAGEPIFLATAYYGLGDFFYRNDDYQQATENLKKALHLVNTSTKFDLLAMIYNVLGAVDYDQNNFLSATQHYLASLEFAKQISDSLHISNAYLNLSLIEYAQGKYQQALQLAKEAQYYLPFNSGLYDKHFLEKHLADTYEQLNFPDTAYSYLKKAYASQQEIYDENVNARVSRQRSLTKKETELALATAAKERSQKLFLLVLTLSLITAFIVGIFLHFKQKKDSIIRYNTEIDKLIEESRKAAKKAQINGQLEERYRVARVLHDTIGSQLTAIRWLYEETIEDHEKNALEVARMEKILEMLNKSYADLRSVVREMEEDKVKVDWLEQLRHFLVPLKESYRLNVDFTVENVDEPLDYTIGEHVYEIVLSLTSNVLKYANARQLTIQIEQFSDELSILVEDDGKGFQPEEVEYGSGMRNIGERMEELDGKWNISSAPNMGTTVTLVIPLHKSVEIHTHV